MTPQNSPGVFPGATGSTVVSFTSGISGPVQMTGMKPWGPHGSPMTTEANLAFSENGLQWVKYGQMMLAEFLVNHHGPSKKLPLVLVLVPLKSGQRSPLAVALGALR